MRKAINIAFNILAVLCVVAFLAALLILGAK